MMFFSIRNLRRLTSCSLIECKRALELCEYQEGVAYEYLKLRYCSDPCFKIVNYKKIPWSDKDYLLEAKRNYENSIKL